jgi:hypothetical protein
MATQFSMLGIINSALLAQGQEEIVSENDGSLEWRVLARNWPSIVEAELEDGNYYFTKRQAEIITRVDGQYGFTDAYVVPSDALHVRHVWLVENGSRISIDWVQDGNYVHLESKAGCWIEYIHVGHLNLWSANFSRGVQKKLEAVVLRAIKEEFGEASNIEQEAETYFQRARTNSSKARTPQPVYKKGPIALARNRRG